MSEKKETVEKCEVVLVYTNFETGERTKHVVEGIVRRNVKLTPEEIEQYQRFRERREQEAREARARRDKPAA